MKKTLCNVLIFAAGTAIGSLVTWKFLKAKYEQIAQEEIESVKETWARKNRENTNEPEVDCERDGEMEEEWSEEVLSDYSSLTHKYDRTLREEIDEEGGGDDDGFPYVNGPVVIEPEDFGDGNYNHSLYCLTYYADGVLADDWWVKQDIEETIGEDALNHFDDHVKDVVYVRNEQQEADYEVTRDPRAYADVVKMNPLVSMHEN